MIESFSFPGVGLNPHLGNLSLGADLNPHPVIKSATI